MTSPDDHDHRDLDLRLRGAFSPPADTEAMARRAVERPLAEHHAGEGRDESRDPFRDAPDLRRHAAPARRVLARRLAAAAALLVAVLGWSWWASVGSEPGTAPTPGPPAGRIHAEAVLALADGLLACNSESQLAQTFRERYGQELHVRIDPTRLLVGPFACASWPSATLLVATLPDPVALLVDALDSDPRLTADIETGIRAHRREIGRLVVYELSRNDEPVCLDLLFTPPD